MSTTKNKPACTLTDGLIEAAIWRNEYDKGVVYSVQISRSYQDKDGNWKRTDSFANGDILKIRRLLGQAYDAIARLKAADKDEGGAA